MSVATAPHAGHSGSPTSSSWATPSAGTTALYEMLRRHPQIHMSVEKEPWYFSPELRFRAPPRKPVGIPDTLEEYLALFAGAAPGQRLGEASTTYLWSRAAAGAIAEVQPDARIVAILREPASFLRSLHLQFLEAHIETEPDLRRALSFEDARRGRRAARQARLLAADAALLRARALRRAVCAATRQQFPAEQLLVLLYDDFRADNEATVRRVLRFLEVDGAAPIEASRLTRRSAPARSGCTGWCTPSSVGRGPASRTVKAAVKALTPDGPRRSLLHAFRRRVRLPCARRHHCRRWSSCGSCVSASRERCWP